MDWIAFYSYAVNLRFSTGGRAYEASLLPKIDPLALCGLLFTVVILFPLQSNRIARQPADFARISVPLLAYFAIMGVLDT